MEPFQVLIVDDDADQLDLMLRALRAEGISCNAAEDDLATEADGYDSFRMRNKASPILSAAEENPRESQGALYDPHLVKMALEHYTEVSVQPVSRQLATIGSCLLKPGMFLAESITSDSGPLLIRAGAGITDTMIGHLTGPYENKSKSVYP